MIGLGSSIAKPGKIGKRIVRDGLVLKHDYNAGAVEPCSTGAASFNGTSDYIDVGTIAIADGDVSISAWVYVTAFIDEAAIFSNRTTAGDRPGVELRCENEGGQVGFELIIDDGVDGSQPSKASANVNQWYHVCGVWDRSDSQYLYVDGVLIDSDPITTESDSLTHSQAARIGKNHSNKEFPGYICNVGYWNAALTQAQVKSIMLKNYAGLSASEKTNLVSWWNLDSVIDSAVYANSSGSTSVYDNHHGGNETLGANIVTGYDLGSGFSEWAVYDPEDGGTTISTDGSIITVNVKDGDPNDNQGARCEITSSLVVGKTYEVTADLWLGTYVPNPAGEFVIYLAGQGIATTLTTTRTTYTRYITATSTSDLIFHQSDADENEGTFFISNVSVKLVNGNTGTLS